MSINHFTFHFALVLALIVAALIERKKIVSPSNDLDGAVKNGSGMFSALAMVSSVFELGEHAPFSYCEIACGDTPESSDSEAAVIPRASRASLRRAPTNPGVPVFIIKQYLSLIS
jgi:hypothetical protein